MALVDYSSDSSDNSDLQPKPKRRRHLPSLPASFDRSRPPDDDPVLHQGRTRSRPYVHGDYYAHVYVELDIPPRLGDTLDSFVRSAQHLVPALKLHSLLTPASSSSSANASASASASAGSTSASPSTRPPRRLPLHVSLTHPLPLRRSDASAIPAELAQAIRPSSSRSYKPFRLSLAANATVYRNARASNDRTGGVGDGVGDGAGGRAFVALRVGAGASELNTIVERAIHPVLDRHHLPRYHLDAEYHASIAWCLVTPTAAAAATTTAQTATVTGERDAAAALEAVLPALNDEFAARVLETQPRNGWLVSAVAVKVAKGVTRIPLA